jgi:SAM-dependent methyltransferase
MVRAGEIEHWQLIAGKEEVVWHWASPAGRLRAKRRARLLVEAGGVTAGKHVLEIGCGTGLFTNVFAATGARVVAIDVCPPLLEKAVARNIDGDVAFQIEDAEQMSFGDQTFDAVIGSSVLHHLDVGQTIGEMHRVLKPGGRIAFAEPNMMNPQIVFERSTPAVRRWVGATPEETAFFRWNLARRLRQGGYDEVKIEPFDFLHPAVPRPLIPLVRGVGGILEQLPLFREIAGSLIISARRS